MITKLKGKLIGSLNKFPQPILEENLWRLVWRICMLILEFKGWRETEMLQFEIISQ